MALLTDVVARILPCELLVSACQRRCKHPDRSVSADILDGDFSGGAGGEQAVAWCQRCGAVRRVFDTYGQRPRYDEWRRV